MIDELTLSRRSVDEMDVIGVDGELDRNTVWQFRELTLDLANRQERRWLAINLNQCSYLHATGLGALIGA